MTHCMLAKHVVQILLYSARVSVKGGNKGDLSPPSQKEVGKIPPPCHTHKNKKLTISWFLYIRRGHFILQQCLNLLYIFNAL